jgi:hypothetical protein
MSGSGKGVCTALAISNAITNLCGMISFSFNLCRVYGSLGSQFCSFILI